MITPDPETGILHLPKPSFVFGLENELTLEWVLGSGDRCWAVHVDWGTAGISGCRTYGVRDDTAAYSVVMDETRDWATVIKWLSQEPEGFLAAEDS